MIGDVRGFQSTETDLSGRHRFSWDALQREWKTPPLWGGADSAPYLHDGRAETLFGTLQEFFGTDDISFEVTSAELEFLLGDPKLQEAYGLDLDDANLFDPGKT
ncbi:MAG: hypothetical protein KDA72_06970 [Planctomycetales bacterium]|nr:hypothetical protein [Planctomycetales bacterium]